MLSKIKPLFPIILFLCFFGFFPSFSFAADFQFDYNVYYSVSQSGSTTIKHDIIVTNLASNYYTQSFTLITTSDQIKNITAWDSIGQITPETEIKNNSVSIKVNFNEKIVGLNKQMRFFIQYESSDVATKKGSIWELIIPGIEKDNQISSYNIFLQVPPNFGQAQHIYPKPNQNNFWSIKELNQGGINIIYGNRQTYSFNLIYNLINQTSRSQIQEIALPPDTAYQKVILSRMSIAPLNVTQDDDGNWLAQYKLKPKEKLKIVAEGNILVYMEPYNTYTVNLSPNNLIGYTKPLKYWENSPEISNRAKELITPRNIYDWVVNNLTYDFNINTSGSTRNGALFIMNNPTLARCMDFSDLFVALSRSAGIPSREIHGYAYTTNSKLQPLSQTSDVLHAWPEYYDFESKNWIAVDPTWGNTTHGIDYFDKLDFNHVTLAILGKQSDYPYPAGSFYTDNASKNVYIELVDKDITIPEPVSKMILNKNTIYNSINKTINLFIYNQGNIMLYPQKLGIISTLNMQNDLEIPPIPPYGFVSIPISVYPKFSLISDNFDININYLNHQVKFNLVIKPFYMIFFPYTLLLFIFVIIFVCLKYGKRKT